MVTTRNPVEISEHWYSKGPYAADPFDWWHGLKEDPYRFVRTAFKNGREQGHKDADTDFSIVCSAHSFMSWAHFGFNVFAPTQNLVSALLLTELEPQLPLLPFPAFRLDLPDRGVPSKAFSGNFIRTAFVSRHQVRGSERPGVDEACAFLIRVGEQDLLFRRGWAPDVFDSSSDRLMLANAEHSAAGASNMDADAKTVIHLIRGMCSFLASKREPLVQDNARRDGRPTKGVRLFTVGRTVKINPELRRIVSEGRGEPLWRLEHRCIVRGHWRNQAHGPGMTERKKIWIEPFWRGPEGAEAWRHVYELGSNATEKP
jgi:hypothetical protein